MVEAEARSPRHLVASAAACAATAGRSFCGLDISVRQRLEEADQGILLVIAQAEIAELADVEILNDFGRGPARYSFAGIIRFASRQDVTRIVEVHDVLQAGEIAVVHVGFDEARVRAPVDIAEGRHLYLASEPPRVFLPVGI